MSERYGALRRHVWTLTFHQSLLGPMLVAARQHGRPTRAVRDIPQYVRDYAEVEERHLHLVSRPSWQELLDVGQRNTDVIRVNARKDNRTLYLTVWIDLPDSTHALRYRGERLRTFPSWIADTHGEEDRWMGVKQLAYIEAVAGRMGALCCHGWNRHSEYWLHGKHQDGDGLAVFCPTMVRFDARYSGRYGVLPYRTVGEMPYRRWNWTRFWALLAEADAACTTDEEDA